GRGRLSARQAERSSWGRRCPVRGPGPLRGVTPGRAFAARVRTWAKVRDVRAGNLQRGVFMRLLFLAALLFGWGARAQDFTEDPPSGTSDATASAQVPAPAASLEAAAPAQTAMVQGDAGGSEA